MKTFPTIDCARHARDGAIDAIAALDNAVRLALEGIDPAQQGPVKHAFGEAMGMVSEHLILQAQTEYPELKPDQPTWDAVVKARVLARAQRYEV